MKTRRTVIPDSEDDAMESGPSVRGSSPLRQLESLRQGGPSHSTSRTTRTPRAIHAGEDEKDEVASNASNHIVPPKVEVVIPTKEDASTSDSARSSLGIPSADGPTGSSTPATSVGVAADSDIKKPRVRVNASARAQQLMSMAASRRTSQRGTKRPIDAVTDEDRDDSDAALAHALQAAEYETPPPPKRRAVSQRGRGGKKLPSRKLEPESPMSSTEDELSSPPMTPLSPKSARIEEALWDGVLDPRDTEDEAESPAPRIPRRPNTYAPSDDSNNIENVEIRDAFETDEELPPSWEEQRKFRRVSIEISRSGRR